MSLYAVSCNHAAFQDNGMNISFSACFMKTMDSRLRGLRRQR
jgi:hypothetical protein